MNTKQKAVDVLAVLDDARRDLQIAADYKGLLLWHESADALIAARAAVAALMAAIEAMLESGDEGAECGSRADLRWGLTKARAAEALARCKGE